MFHGQKSLGDQVVVITGATSGIGLATARLFAARGARLVLAARSADDLADVQAELAKAGHDVVVVAADVGRRADVESIATKAIDRFGGFDTWVNNAGQTVYGQLQEVSDADHERLMQVNFWGTVYGSLVAVRTLKARGGTLVNVGSVGGDFAFPLQGMYSASKHAIRGFTDALRMELEQEGAPVAVTLVKPASIDTPLPQRARNYMTHEPKLPPPVYRPREVALAIAKAATSPNRDIYVGGAAKALSLAAAIAPRLYDRAATPVVMAFQKRNEAPRRPQGTLHATGSDHGERGTHPGFVIPFSASIRFGAVPTAVLGIAAAVAVTMALTAGGPAAARAASRRPAAR